MIGIKEIPLGEETFIDVALDRLDSAYKPKVLRHDEGRGGYIYRKNVSEEDDVIHFAKIPTTMVRLLDADSVKDTIVKKGNKNHDASTVLVNNYYRTLCSLTAFIVKLNY